MVKDYGGAESWLEEITKNSRWIDESAYSERHAEDEVSYNARHAIERLAELAQSVSGLAEAITRIIQFQKDQADANNRIANASIRYSIVGLVLIFIGFSMQLIAAMHWL